MEIGGEHPAENKEDDAKPAKKICNPLSTSVGEARNPFHMDCSFRCPEPVMIENERVFTHLFLTKCGRPIANEHRTKRAEHETSSGFGIIRRTLLSFAVVFSESLIGGESLDFQMAIKCFPLQFPKLLGRLAT